jgi:SAM-dependent methyltransferase
MPVTFSLPDVPVSPSDAGSGHEATPEQNIAHWRDLHEDGAYFAEHPRYKDRLHADGVERLTRYLTPNSTDTLLEIGCGYGRLLWHLRPLVNRAIGVDLAHEPIEQARKLMGGRGGADFHVVAGTDLTPIETNTVDAVAVFTVFQHMTRAGAAAYAAEIARVLRPGGRLAAQFLAGTGEQNIEPIPGEQSIGYSASQVAAFAESAGLEVHAVEREWLIEDYPTGNATWMWLHARKPSGWRLPG